MHNYYVSELNAVIPRNKTEITSIKLVKGHRCTKWMDLNLESIEKLENFLNELKKRIENEN